MKCFKGLQTEHLMAQCLMDYPPLQSHAPRSPTPVVYPSWSLASAKPAEHTLSSINIFQTWHLYTDSDQIFHCVWMKGCSIAVLLKPSP